MSTPMELHETMRLRPRGVGRAFTGGFLLLWLTGWAAGECFALYALARGALALFTGQPINNGGHPMALPIALGIGAFLLLWLTLWTFGGIMALREFLRTFWAEDRLVAGPEGLEIEHQIGPFVEKKLLRHEELREIHVRRLMRNAPSAALVMETATGMVELSRLGTGEERDQIATQLRGLLRLEERRPESTPTLPDGWEEVVTPEGTPVLVTSPKTRAIQTRVGVLIAFAFAAFAAGIVRESATRPALIPFALILTALAIFAVWGVIWLARGRMEWRIGSGRIVLRRRFGARVTDQFTADGLELGSTRDSDGDEWYALDAIGADAAGRPGRKRIARTMSDPTVPRRLGAWLAMRGSMTCTDKAGGADIRIELAALVSQLEQSGPLGKLAARFVGQLGSRVKPQR